MWLVFLILLLITVFLDWYAISINNKKIIIYFAKPAIIVVLISASLYYLWPLNNQTLFLIIGLFFSLIGDILLMLPKDQFLGGLASFLFAQISYIIALQLFPINTNEYIPTAILILILILVVGQILPLFREGLKRADKQKLTLPISLYIIASSIFVLAALSHFYKSGNQAFSAYLFSSGALLFLISDLILGWNRFIEKIPNAKMRIHVTYHLAQILLTVGFIFNFV